jgi:hypothetical protein
VKRLVAPAMRRRGLRLKRRRLSQDRLYAACLFASPRLKLYLYDSIRDGEVNALVAGPDADDSGEERNGWIYIRQALYLETERPSVEKLLKLVPARARSTEDQLRELIDIFETYHEAILRMVAEPQPERRARLGGGAGAGL